jgi:hypothetical protein
MNYFAHGIAFIDEPYFLAGTAVPDWLNVVARRARVRSKHAVPFTGDSDPRLASLAGGIARHHADDAWFHQTRAFAELSCGFAMLVREHLPDDDGLRPSFLGHILVEILLDACLIAREPARLDAYYGAMAAIDGPWLESAVGRMATNPPDRLSQFIPLFVRERFLWDYLDDGKLCYRLNQVMRRVGLPALVDRFALLLPDMRRQVSDSAELLLTPE